MVRVVVGRAILELAVAAPADYSIAAYRHTGWLNQ